MSAPVAGADALLRWRDEFPILQHTTHLVSHSLGAMPRAARRALDEYAETWERRGVRAWSEGWWEMSATVGDELAPLLGAPAGSVTMHPNVTLAQAILLSSFDWRVRRNKLVCTDLDFPSLLYLYEGLSREGARVVRVPSRDGRTIDSQELADAVDEETAVVAFSHVIFRTGSVVDPAPVAEKARAVGAFTLLDAYQSVGTLPVNVTALGVDALVGGSVKWLCGGPGAGYMYVAPERAATLMPRLTGWMAHAEPFAFAPPPLAPAASHFRFLNGTPNISAFYAARAAYRILLEVGIKAIRARSVTLTERLRRAAGERGWPVVSPADPERRGGTLVLDVPEAERVQAALDARQILVDRRPGVGLRVGPHFYNTEAEIDVLVAAVDEILAGG